MLAAINLQVTMRGLINANRSISFSQWSKAKFFCRGIHSALRRQMISDVYSGHRIQHRFLDNEILQQHLRRMSEWELPRQRLMLSRFAVMDFIYIYIQPAFI